jgi:hypothetical protein
MRIIFQIDAFRIVELVDECTTLKDLKGDTYNHEVNPDIPLEQLQIEEKTFERQVETFGVYGYELQRWNSEIDKGWEHVDSCWGFVGQYDSKTEMFNHYIVDVMKKTAGGL